MAYNDFSLDVVKRQFGLEFEERHGCFADVQSVPVSNLLWLSLDAGLPLALGMKTPKAYSELVIMPVLLEVYRQMEYDLGLFSGVQFDVDFDKGLFGTCDFLLSRSDDLLRVEPPVIAVVEVRNRPMIADIGSCAAKMVAAQAFNARSNNPIPTVYGIITTGVRWNFLRLTGNLVTRDTAKYYIGGWERIVGILLSTVMPPTPQGHSVLGAGQ